MTLVNQDRIEGITSLGKSLLSAADATQGRQLLAIPPASSNAWQVIANDTLAGVAGWSKNNLSAFRALRLRGFLRPATDAQVLRLRTSTNNGGAYDVGAADYLMQELAQASGTATASQATAAFISLSGYPVGNIAGEGTAFFMEIEAFNKAQNMHLTGRSATTTDAGAFRATEVAAMRLQQTARDAILIAFASGNIAQGWITLEGLEG